MAKTIVDGDDVIIAASEPPYTAGASDTVGDIIFKTGGTERARITAAGVGSGFGALLGGSLSATGDITISADTGNTGTGDIILKSKSTELLRIGNPSNISHVTLQMTGVAGHALSIVQNDLTGQAPLDLIDLQGQSSGDVIFAVNRCGDPPGYVGSSGGKCSFNTVIPYYRDYSDGVGWVGTVVNDRTGMKGLQVMQQTPNASATAAYLCNYGNAYAVQIDAQIGGGAPGGQPKGTGGGIELRNASVQSAIAITNTGTPQATGDIFTGALPDAMLYLYANAGATIRAVQIYDANASKFGYVAQSDGTVSITTSLRIGNANTFAGAGHTVDVEPVVGDSAAASVMVNYTSATWAPTSDVGKGAYALYGQLLVSDTNAGATLTSAYTGVFGRAEGTNATRTVTQLIGGQFIGYAHGAATVSLAQGVLAQVVRDAAGVTTNGETIRAGAPSITAGTVTTIYGLRIMNQGQANSTTAYGLFIEAQSGAGTKNIALHVDGGNVELNDAVNLALGTTTGTKIGTATTQKLGFYNAAPIVQPATTGTATGFTAGGGTTATHLSTFTGNTGSTAYTVGDIVNALKLLGLLAA